MNQRDRSDAGRRRGFTMTEMLVAGTVTSLVAAAGATFVSAVSNAAGQTRDLRSAKTSGHYALGRMVRAIRESRGIGQITSSSVTLWVEDKNGNDQINLYETGTIRYDAQTGTLFYEYMQPASPMANSAVVSLDELKNIAVLQSRMAAAPSERREAAWAEEVQSMNFIGHPNNTDARVVDFRMVLGDGNVIFRGTASPRAPANYLYYEETQNPPSESSVRKVRKYAAGWNGFSDLISTLGTLTPDGVLLSQ